ncbi:uncharacterized protein [Ptychodera flava]|uniref:uncharacterized protein n=1 Tax=Ptychodera flava TaxID=63121 RepID=UPI00396A0CEF
MISMAVLHHTLSLTLLYHVTLLVHGLTNDELAKFRTSGIAESNTNQIGWVSVATEGDLHIFTSNVIPDHQTGSFPNQDNPHSIIEQDFQISVPVTPSEAETPGCLPMGPIGISVNGIPIFNLVNARGEDATEVEVFDVCNGHPDPTGRYHYHDLPTCILDRSNDESELIGVTIDGYPIYGPTDENGNNLTSADLDVCSGRCVDGFYQYHFTEHHPYSIGCLKGVPAQITSRGRCFFACNKMGTDKDSDLSFCDDQTDEGQTPGGRHPGDNNPDGEMPSGGRPGGKRPGCNKPKGNGQTPGDGNPSDEMPMPNGGHTGDQTPSGDQPGGEMPMPNGQIPSGAFPDDQMPIPSGYRPHGQMPGGYYPGNEIPGNTFSGSLGSGRLGRYFPNRQRPKPSYQAPQYSNGYYQETDQRRPTFDGSDAGYQMQGGQYRDGYSWNTDQSGFNQQIASDRRYGSYGPNRERRFRRSTKLGQLLLGHS